MKKSIIAVLAVSAISTLGSSAAFAHEDYSEGGALHWPCLLYTTDASDDMQCVDIGVSRSL